MSQEPSWVGFLIYGLIFATTAVGMIYMFLTDELARFHPIFLLCALVSSAGAIFLLSMANAYYKRDREK